MIFADWFAKIYEHNYSLSLKSPNTNNLLVFSVQFIPSFISLVVTRTFQKYFEAFQASFVARSKNTARDDLFLVVPR